MSNFAVVTTCYNEGQYIEQCVRSVIAQTVAAQQHVVVNDGSTDNSQATLNQFQHLTALDITNRGMPGARNAGLLALKPWVDWVVFLDGDDWLEPNFIELIQTTVTSVEDIIIPRFRRVPGGEPELPEILFPTLDEIRYKCYISFGVIRRSLLEKMGGFHPLMGGDCDWDFWIDALYRGAKLAYCPGTWVNYRQHDASFTSTRSIESRNGNIAEMERHFA